MLKRVVDSNKNARNKPIELLSQQYGKNMQIFHDIKVLMKLLSQIQKKRAMKKKAE